jgi:hypothetical protein
MTSDTDTALTALTAALHSERRILEQLREALIAQRATLAAGEPTAVCTEADLISRILLTLQEARRHRAAVLDELVHDPRLPLTRLAAALGRPLPPALIDAQFELRRILEGVMFDAAVNRTVLRRVLDSGESYLHSLFAAAQPASPSYTARETREEPRAGSALFVNRRA